MPLPILGAATSLLGGLSGVAEAAAPIAGMFGGSKTSSSSTGPVSFGDFNVQSRNSRSSPWPIVALAAAVLVVVAVLFWPRRPQK